MIFPSRYASEEDTRLSLEAVEFDYAKSSEHGDISTHM